MDSTKIRRHLFAAVRTLGTDEGTVDRRLRKVYNALRDMPVPDYPDHIRQAHAALMTDLAELFDGRQKVDLARASRLARRVVALYEQVIDEL